MRIRHLSLTALLAGVIYFSYSTNMQAMSLPGADRLIAAAGITAAPGTSTNAAPAKKKPKTAPAATVKKPVRPQKQYLTFQEIDNKGYYKVIESYMYRMCIQEVPFFLALHRCFYQDQRLVKGDTLVITRSTMQVLLLNTASHLHTSDLNISPVTNIDSMMLFKVRHKGVNPADCNIIIFTQAGEYEIPKTGARIAVPAVIRAGIACNARSGRFLVAIFSNGVRLELPGYAKILSFGLISDMDIGFAELLPSGTSYEARLLYATKEKDVKRRGWAFNITECNKIRPYAK